MKSTFNLKEPNSEKEGLIFFSAFFKNENRKFVYSTGEHIHKDQWDFDNREPNDLTGRSEKAAKHREIKRQLDRYSNFFTDLTNLYKLNKQDFTIADVREKFDSEFKRTKAISNKFFEVYELFLQDKRSDYTEDANLTTTIKRYGYNKKHLEDYQKYINKPIHFHSINKNFYNSFVQYCVSEKQHGANTLRRNMGMFKTFLKWSLENGHTYKVDFQKFKLPKEQPTDEIALSMEQVQAVFSHDFSKKPKLERIRDLFVFGCATGMRISNYGNVRKKDIDDGFIKVRDFKNKDKFLEVPLNDLSNYILEKYKYQLPKISTQKFNVYIKDVFEDLGFTHDVKKTTKLGSEIIETITPFYKRISSHTARRSFITIMLNEKIPYKVIMSYTGHKDFKVFMKYYKPNKDEKKVFMQTVWKMDATPLKMVN